MICFGSSIFALHAESKYPADITYMVADLRYSKEHGVKLCEIQQGILSKFMGDVFLNGPHGNICPKVEQFFAEFPQKKWMMPYQIVSDPLKQLLSDSPLWVGCTEITLVKDQDFLARAAKKPVDPADIMSYQGMLFARAEVSENYEEFHQKYPGILVIDAPSHTYWIDKYKMTMLFQGDEKLTRIKPEWGLYSKQYTATLAEEIKRDISSDIFVIKPRSAFLGKGVIIVSAEDLDATLAYILTPTKILKLDPDVSYSYWAIDRSDSFIVEKYYSSDLLQFEDKLYDPTMRAAFMFIYTNNTIEMRFLDCYWILPEHAVDEGGSLNQRKKSFAKPPLYLPATSEELEAVRLQCTETLPLLYQKMLNQEL